MNIIFDFIIVAIIATNVILGWKQGFVKMALKSLTLVVALVAAFSLVNPVRDYVLSTNVANEWENKIYESVVTVLDGVETDTEEESKEENDALPKLESLLSSLGVDTDGLKNDIEQWKDNKTDEIKHSIAEKTAYPLLKASVTFVSFIGVFFAVYVLALIAVFLLDKFTALPVLKQANTLLGIIVGLVLAVAEASVFVSSIQLLLPINALSGIFANFSPESTLLFKFFGSFNIFRMLF